MSTEKQRAYAKAYHERKKADPEYMARRRAAYKRHNDKRRAPEQIRAASLWSRYRLTLDGATSLWESQGRVCAGCGSPVPDPGKVADTSLPRSAWSHIDHCHSSGKVRGVLCHMCNMALGHVSDSPDTLRALANYLEMPR